MTIERLHKVAMMNVHDSFRAKWLQWWNSSAEFRAFVRFLEDNLMKDKVLDTWLHRASLWAQVLKMNLHCSLSYLN